jgi:hypothetical protein
LKHFPFQSSYREDFEVVEQLQGDLRLFPHTDQLPVLLRALNLEFYRALPGYIARVDHRGDGFHKLLRKEAALMFCAGANAARQDEVRLYALLDSNLVARVTVVQQLTQNTRRGPVHRFRFYGGEDFFPEIQLSGKRLLFTDHVLKRFSARVPNNLGEDLSFFLLSFYGSPMISLPVGPGRALIVSYGESVLVFTYTETDQEFVITTCLTVNEMSSLSLEVPTPTFNLHYGPDFAKPRLRNWLPHQWAAALYSRWERKAPLPPPISLPKTKSFNWHAMACRIKDCALANDKRPGIGLRFMDDIPGPADILIRPGQIDPEFDEVTFQITAPLSPAAAAPNSQLDSELRPTPPSP